MDKEAKTAGWMTRAGNNVLDQIRENLAEWGFWRSRYHELANLLAILYEAGDAAVGPVPNYLAITVVMGEGREFELTLRPVGEGRKTPAQMVEFYKGLVPEAAAMKQIDRLAERFGIVLTKGNEETWPARVVDYVIRAKDRELEQRDRLRVVESELVAVESELARSRMMVDSINRVHRSAATHDDLQEALNKATEDVIPGLQADLDEATWAKERAELERADAMAAVVAAGKLEAETQATLAALKRTVDQQDSELRALRGR